MRRDFENDNVVGYIEFIKTTVVVDVREKRPGGQRARKTRVFRETESARRVYAAFVGIINTGPRGLSFVDLAR